MSNPSSPRGMTSSTQSHKSHSPHKRHHAPPPPSPAHHKQPAQRTRTLSSDSEGGHEFMNGRGPGKGWCHVEFREEHVVEISLLSPTPIFYSFVIGFTKTSLSLMGRVYENVYLHPLTYTGRSWPLRFPMKIIKRLFIFRCIKVNIFTNFNSFWTKLFTNHTNIDHLM